MTHSILITGASGYLGDEQAEQVKRYGAEPIKLDLEDEDAVVKTIVDAKISIIFFLIDALNSKQQVPLIKALGELKKKTGQDVHFLHTSGAKIFSEHAGMPTDREISAADPGLSEMQKTIKSPHSFMSPAVATNNTVIETSELYGVNSYIFIPCIVYGEGEGFGNRISIQTTAVVQAAKKLRVVYDVNPEGATWPVCHIHDNTTLYVKLLQSILRGGNPDHGKSGCYLASSGSVSWRDIYVSMAKVLAERNVVDSIEVKKADATVLDNIGQALGCPSALVPVQIGGKCTLRSDRASQIGWRAEYPSKYILQAAETEADLILKNSNDEN